MAENRCRQRKEKCLKILNRGLALAIVAVCIYHVTVVNELSIKGFELQKIQDEKETLENRNEQLNLEVASLRSYNKFSQRTEDLDMVASGEVDYITVREGVMAKK